MSKDRLKKLVKNFKNGDDAVFEEIYLITNRLVFYVVTSMIKDKDAVQDIVQDTYIKAFKNIHQLKGDNFQAWINSIANNTAKDHLKKKRPLLFDDYLNEEDSYSFEIEDENDDYNPEIVSNKKESQRILNDILDSINEDQRICVVMFYFQELTTKEIAKILELSENSVKSRLRYARLKIKESVNELESQGVKLYSIAPLPLIKILLTDNSSSYVVSKEMYTQTLDLISRNYNMSNSLFDRISKLLSKPIGNLSPISSNIVKVVVTVGLVLSPVVVSQVNPKDKFVLEAVSSSPYIINNTEEDNLLKKLVADNNDDVDSRINLLDYYTETFDGIDGFGNHNFEWKFIDDGSELSKFLSSIKVEFDFVGDALRPGWGLNKFDASNGDEYVIKFIMSNKDLLNMYEVEDWIVASHVSGLEERNFNFTGREVNILKENIVYSMYLDYVNNTDELSENEYMNDVMADILSKSVFKYGRTSQGIVGMLLVESEMTTFSDYYMVHQKNIQDEDYKLSKGRIAQSIDSIVEDNYNVELISWEYENVIGDDKYLEIYNNQKIYEDTHIGGY